MAIAFVGGGGSTGTSFSFNIGTAGTNRLVTILAGDESSGNYLTNVTVDGKTCTLIKAANNTAGAGNHLEMWYIDEAGLGASNGTVTIAITGGNSGWATHATLHTGVAQTGYNDFGFDETSAAITTLTVTGIDVAANGAIIGGFGEGTAGLSVNSITSPLTLRQNGPNPSSASLRTYEGIESSTQTNKTYTITYSNTFFRGCAIIASWDEFAESTIMQTHQMML